ncbi:MAG TPA: HAMP domain-containing sensor histidine kinase, partial [Ktedonobacteraceae bacterium]|nr:HAMP domain-containing sensor histidine kinase [Ktedonobacteraceae bacterium]
ARERTRQSLFLSEQEVRARAEALAMSNQALVESKIRLEQLDQLKDRFIAQASHELKTPVTTIQGQVQLALRRLSQQKELPNSLATLPTQLEKIETQTHRLHSLIDDLLDLSSLRAGSLPLRKSHCNITQLCRDVVEEQIALTARHIDLDLPATPQFLDVDAERLSQVVINLVTNAIKYSSEGTVVQVSMRQESAYLLLQVHNIGSSIPKEQQAHIFEPFYRSPNARSSSKPGWGLGLAISKDIVERHGGRIWVESEEAKGTTFFVCLPTQSDQEKGEERKPEEQ